MKSFRLINWLDRHRGIVVTVSIPLLLLLIAGVYLLVYHTGGIQYAYAHSMYVPILAAGLIFGVSGGIVVGIIGGILLGPFMPLDVAAGEAQRLTNWLVLLGFFCVVGALTGSVRNAIAWYVRQIRQRLSHDPLTGFPNRASLLERLRKIRDARKHDDASPVLIMALLENADEIDTGFGWHATNQIISEMGRRLAAIGGDDAIVFRHGVNRICLPVTCGTDENALEQDIMRLRSKLSQPYRIEDGLSIHADEFVAAIGIDNDFDNAEDELRRSEAALMLARESNRRPLISAGAAEYSAHENLSLLGQLLSALDSGQLDLHYQPKVELSSGRVVGAEGLIRWNHPELGMIPPLRFIPRAEQSTLIEHITRFALTSALLQAKRWNARGMSLCLGINITARDLAQESFGTMVRTLLEQHEIPGEQLELEVTEGALVREPERTAEILHRLADLNIAMSIDDFGTGYSSLQYLAELPVSVIKIDRLFIQRLTGESSNRHIVEATINLSHRLDMRVVAEGVEDERSLTMLDEMGCDMAQGYHFARPMPAEEFERWYEACGGRFDRASVPS